MRKTFRAAVRLFYSGFEQGAETEEMFFSEIKPLLKNDFQIVWHRYTMNPRSFTGVLRFPKSPTDFEVIHNGLVLCAVDVTTGSAGWSFARSKTILISEDKLARTDRYAAGFVVERVLTGEPHWIWSTREKIRAFQTDVNGNYVTTPDIWTGDLSSLVERFYELVELEESVQS